MNTAGNNMNTAGNNMNTAGNNMNTAGNNMNTGGNNMNTGENNMIKDGTDINENQLMAMCQNLGKGPQSAIKTLRLSMNDLKSR